MRKHPENSGSTCRGDRPAALTIVTSKKNRPQPEMWIQEWKIYKSDQTAEDEAKRYAEELNRYTENPNRYAVTFGRRFSQPGNVCSV